MMKLLKKLFGWLKGLCYHEWNYGVRIYTNHSCFRSCRKCGRNEKKINGNTGDDFEDNANWRKD